jgi:hypothetical protein
MAIPQQLLYPIDFRFKGKDGKERVHKCVLSLSFSLSIAEVSTSGSGDGLGTVTVYGAVMPVDDPKGGSSSTTPALQLLAEDGDTDEQQVAA